MAVWWHTQSAAGDVVVWIKEESWPTAALEAAFQIVAELWTVAGPLTLVDIYSDDTRRQECQPLVNHTHPSSSVNSLANQNSRRTPDINQSKFSNWATTNCNSSAVKYVQSTGRYVLSIAWCFSGLNLSTCRYFRHNTAKYQLCAEIII